MINALYGALGAVLVLLLFAAGVYVGYRLHRRYMEHEASKRPTPIAPEEQERRRLIEDQKAFRDMMGYNAEMAFGVSVAPDFRDEGGEV